MATNWKQRLASDRSPASRCAALILVVFVVAAFISVPFVIWWGHFQSGMFWPPMWAGSVRWCRLMQTWSPAPLC
jgi:hypothetical protein